MQFKLDDTVQQFKLDFKGLYDEIKVDENYFESKEGHETVAITLTNELKVKEYIYCVVTFPDGGGYDVDFVYQNDEATPGITKEHYPTLAEVVEGWKRFISLYK